VLLDATHKRWCWVTLALAVLTLGLWGLLDYFSSAPLTGATTVGLWYGIIGALLMIYAGLLAAHRRAPRWQWLGKRQTWLRGHIWLGSLSGVFLLCHSGFRLGGLLEQLLWVAVAGTLITGVIGLFLQNALPRSLTDRVQSEAPYEQLPHLCRKMRRRADFLVDEICGDQEAAQAEVGSTRAIVRVAEDGRLQLRLFYEQQVRPFLQQRLPGRSPLLNPLQIEVRFDRIRRLSGMETAGEKLAELATMCNERRQLAEQERLHFLLHAWLFIHIPFSVGILVLGIAHVIGTLYY
jgi:hypothetical protein